MNLYKVLNVDFITDKFTASKPYDGQIYLGISHHYLNKAQLLFFSMRALFMLKVSISSSINSI